MSYDEMIEELKEKMIFFRKNYLHMTQKEVAKDCGISPANVSNFERDRIEFSVRLFLWYVSKGFDFNKALEGDYWPATRVKKKKEQNGEDKI